MPLTFYVDRQAWRAHHHRVLADRPALVPVVKGNGYGFTLPVLAEAARQLGPAGVDQIAVGTAQEAARVLAHFPRDLVLLEPFLPGAEWVDLPERVVRNAASVDAVRTLAGRRLVIDCRSSLRRQGVARTELRELRRALRGDEAEGYCVHLPIERPARADPVREVSDWVFALREAGLAVPVMYVSHLSRPELDALGLRFPRTRFRLRAGTDLWLGDRSAIEARATVLDVLPVARGERIGYRQGRARRGGWIVVVSGGTVHGVGLEAPRVMRGVLPRAKELGRSGLRAVNRTLSPFSWQGRRHWFAEPPHMSVSMIHLPGTQAPPRPGGELVADLRHTATHFDRVAIFNEDLATPGSSGLLPRQGAAGARPAACASSSS
jgi:Alanine racemase, N-terminal domain